MWETDLRKSKQKVVRCIRNAALIIRNDGLAGRLAYNRMSAAIDRDGVPLVDTDFTEIRIEIDNRYGVDLGEELVMKAAAYVAAESTYHPVADRLSALKWDGTPRLQDMAERILRAPPDPIYSAFTRRWMIGLVARPLRPGCKLDTMLVLAAEQGYLKSSFFGALGGDYFSDSFVSLDSKDAYLLLGVTWLWEWAELDIASRATEERIKSVLSSQQDLFRVPYARGPIKVPRTCVIVGSTNKESFLRDPSGSRRYWVVPCGKIDLDLLGEWREQLLAEAVHAFRGGEQWWLTPEEEAERKIQSADYEEQDPWIDAILRWAPGKDKFTTADALSAVNMSTERMDRRSHMRMADLLRNLGYSHSKLQQTVGRVRLRFWSRVSRAPLA